MIADALMQRHAAHVVVGCGKHPIHHELEGAGAMKVGIEARRLRAGNVVGPACSQSAEDFLATWRVEIAAKDERAVIEKVKKPIAGAALEIERASVVRPREMRRGDGE